MTPVPAPPPTACPTCGHGDNHNGNPGAQIACATARFQRDQATAWIADHTPLTRAEATRLVAELATTVGTANGVRADAVLRDHVWRAT